jgi:hypothetical protein
VRLRSGAFFLLLLAPIAALGNACGTNGLPTVIVVPDAGGGGEGGFPFDGGGGGGGGDDGPVDLPDVPDAAASPVYVGITPNPDDDATPAGATAADVVTAQLVTVAAGVRGAVVTHTLADLEDGATVSGLDALGTFYAAHGQQVLFELTVIDRAADGRSADLQALSWTSHRTVATVEGAIDLVLAHVGGALAYLTIGRDVDVFLGTHPEQRDAFVELAGLACAYAQQHGPKLQVGVGFSFAGVTAPDPSFAGLRDMCGLAAVSYLPGISAGAAPAPSEVPHDADLMVTAAAGKPIALTEVGTPTEAMTGGSEAQQALFFQTFFSALAERTSAFPFVNVFQLNDLSPADCAAYAVAQGEGAESNQALFVCSAGLFGAGGMAKSAWSTVLNGTATFASP